MPASVMPVNRRTAASATTPHNNVRQAKFNPPACHGQRTRGLAGGGLFIFPAPVQNCTARCLDTMARKYAVPSRNETLVAKAAPLMPNLGTRAKLSAVFVARINRLNRLWAAGSPACENTPLNVA